MNKKSTSGALGDAAFIKQVYLLKEQFDAKQYALAAESVSKIRVYLITNGVLFSNESLTTNDISMIQDVLEIGAYISLFQRNMTEFVKYMNHLKTYYYDIMRGLPKDATITQSPRMYPLIGLDLLRCLVQHRLTEFHTLLECLPSYVLLSNVYIKGSIVLELCMIEGSFQKALKSCADIPGPEYQYFMECMIDSLRDELADCFEVAYNIVPKAAAMNLLFCRNEQDLMNFIQKRNWEYDAASDLVCFPKHARSTVLTTHCDMDLLLERNLFIARQMEKIV